MAGLEYPWYFSTQGSKALHWNQSKSEENKTSVTEKGDTQHKYSQGTRDFVRPIL